MESAQSSSSDSYDSYSDFALQEATSSEGFESDSESEASFVSFESLSSGETSHTGHAADNCTRDKFSQVTYDSSTRLLLEACEEPLYESSAVSMFHAYLLIFQFGLRHSLSAKAFGELIALLIALLPVGAKIPKSVYSLKGFFNKLFPEVSESHLQPYCSSCHKLLSHCDRDECSGCGIATFVSLPFGKQLKRIVEGN